MAFTYPAGVGVRDEFEILLIIFFLFGWYKLSLRLQQKVRKNNYYQYVSLGDIYLHK